MDSTIGMIIQQLKNDGLYENTIVFFYSDHGDGLPFVKREAYDRGLQVPMIVRISEKLRVKGRKPAGPIDDQSLSFVDSASRFALNIGQVQKLKSKNKVP